MANYTGIFRELLLNTTGNALLNNSKKKISNQTIFNKSGKTKKKEKLQKEEHWEPCKLILYSALQTFKDKTIQVPA